nr:heavy metal-associated domain-containing protein [Gallaecimonas mangrovi]
MSKSIAIALPSISCGGCVNAVQGALDKVAGVSSYNVSLDDHQATVEGDADSATIIKAIEDAGFDAELIKE